MSRRPTSPDTGSVSVLLVGVALTVLALVAVVADASQVFLARRALVAACDGAALAAAQQLDEARVYAGEGGPVLSPEAVRSRVATWQAEQAGEMPTLRLAGTSDGETVVVTGELTVRLPFPQANGRREVTVHARAESRLAGVAG